MQILEIIIYGNNGEKRTLSLVPGKVNIITGDSATGKSALIEIVDYCLGKSDCSVPSGIIRDTVSWFAIKLQLKNQQMFIARVNPPVGKTNSSVYFEQGKNIQSPETPPEKSNSTVDALVENLSNKIGISPNLYVPPRGQTREKLSATIRHTSFFCFQKQDEIANSKFLFHRQTDGFITQAIKDTLEYFLGAIREDKLALLQKLHIEKRKLNKLQREYSEEEAIKGEGLSRAIQLLTESIDSGILEDKYAPIIMDDYVKILKKVIKWEPKELRTTKHNKLMNLQNELFELKESLREKNLGLNSALMFADEIKGFTDEISHQEKRLESIHLIPHEDTNDTCPFCSQFIEKPTRQIKEMHKMLDQIKNNLENTSKTNVNIRELLNQLELEREDLRKQIDEKTIQISTLLKDQEKAKKDRDENIRQSEIVGKVKFWLESITNLSDDSDLSAKIKRQEKIVDELEGLIADEEKVMRLTRILDSLGRTMTLWSQELNLEHSEHPVFFDLPKLTIGVQRGDEYIQLSDMGSAENWLGYHLIINFALHQYFLKHNRPLPRFLFLDQPSQVYYPPELAKNAHGDIEILNDEDRKSVNRLFNFIFDKTNSMNGEFQVIITDHAKLSSKSFSNAIVEEWRNGKKLVPSHWI